jgi:hypothetical protein
MAHSPGGMIEGSWSVESSLSPSRGVPGHDSPFQTFPARVRRIIALRRRCATCSAGSVARITDFSLCPAVAMRWLQTTTVVGIEMRFGLFVIKNGLSQVPVWLMSSENPECSRLMVWTPPAINGFAMGQGCVSNIRKARSDCHESQLLRKVSECMSSEPFGQVSNRFKRGSGPSELKLWLQNDDAAGVVARWF